ncbi:MAG TPA: cytochrome c biogenesis protein CcdC [Terracidiphilus sp.]|nr:cytochrome c biogenesis protein CcdC [Terracidiphilus sp.]
MHLSPGAYGVGSIAGLLVIMVWRVREGRTAVTAKKLLMPPLGMATGFSMFFVRACRIPWTWGLASFAIGAILFAYPLLLTSSLRRDGDTIMMKRSGAFFAVVIVLFAIRYLARGYFDRLLTIEQTGAVFYLLAFGMIVRWRAHLYLAYRALTVEPALATENPAEEAAD